jgi:integrase
MSDLAKLRELAKTPGRKPVPGCKNLRLDVERRGKGDLRRVYVFRYTLAGRAREMTLGDYAALTLTQARLERDRQLVVVRSGIDPLAQREAIRQANLRSPAKGKTISEAVEAFIADKSGNKRSGTVMAWQGSGRYLAKIDVPLIEMTRAHVIDFLRPFWREGHSNTGLVVRNFAHRCFDYAIVVGWVPDNIANPWIWKGRLDKVFNPAPKRKPFPAVPYERLPAVYQRLTCNEDRKGHSIPDSIPERAVRFALLTAARPDEVIGLPWREIALAAALWSLPEARSKTKNLLRTPLTGEALACLGEAGEPDALVFPGQDGKLDKETLLDALRRVCVDPTDADATVHGTARSAFRNWAGDETRAQQLTIEMCLGHRVGGTEGSYYTSDALAKRREVLVAWTAYLTGAKACE